MSEVYLQTCGKQEEAGKKRVFVVVGDGGGYDLFEYELSDNPGVSKSIRKMEFKGKDKRGNYTDFQGFVKAETNAEAFFVDEPVILPKGLENILRNHVDWS